MDPAGSWLLIVLFGAYHGVNPGMGWLFALSAGLQSKSERALWLALVPIALGHAASVAIVAVVVLVGLRFFPMRPVQIVTALLLVAFGVYKLFNWYRHPRWVGMKVGLRGLFFWSFLMATAHGAGLMVAPALAQVAGSEAAHVAAHTHVAPSLAHAPGADGRDLLPKHPIDADPQQDGNRNENHNAHAGHLGSLSGSAIWLGVLLHTLVMLVVMGFVALIVYRKLGLAVLRQAWINFDLIWAGALLVVGVVALGVALF